VYADRDRPDTYISICEFASAEDAAANSALPETQECAAAIAAICDGPVIFTNLELVEELTAEPVA
jgi:quinol monooxygenase YgiN